MKNSILIHYFLVNLVFFLWNFCVFKNISCKAFYSGKNWGLERLPNNVGFIPNLSHYCRKLAFFVSETLATYVGVCLHMRALAHIHRLYVGRGLIWSFYFQK